MKNEHIHELRWWKGDGISQNGKGEALISIMYVCIKSMYVLIRGEACLKSKETELCHD